MNYRKIGNTAISVSEIAFGAWGIGGITKDARAYGHTMSFIRGLIGFTDIWNN